MPVATMIGIEIVAENENHEITCDDSLCHFRPKRTRVTNPPIHADTDKKCTMSVPMLNAGNSRIPGCPEIEKVANNPTTKKIAAIR